MEEKVCTAKRAPPNVSGDKKKEVPRLSPPGRPKYGVDTLKMSCWMRKPFSPIGHGVPRLPRLNRCARSQKRNAFVFEIQDPLKISACISFPSTTLLYRLSRSVRTAPSYRRGSIRIVAFLLYQQETSFFEWLLARGISAIESVHRALADRFLFNPKSPHGRSRSPPNRLPNRRQARPSRPPHAQRGERNSPCPSSF